VRKFFESQNIQTETSQCSGKILKLLNSCISEKVNNSYSHLYYYLLVYDIIIILYPVHLLFKWDLYFL